MIDISPVQLAETIDRELRAYPPPPAVHSRSERAKVTHDIWRAQSHPGKGWRWCRHAIDHHELIWDWDAGMWLPRYPRARPKIRYGYRRRPKEKQNG